MKALIHVLGENGYVWDADGENWRLCCACWPHQALGTHPCAAPSIPEPAVAHWLRLECGLVGAMVGGVAGALRCVARRTRAKQA